jgi:hypothetical protein
LPAGETPRNATDGKPGYDYALQEDKNKLIEFHSTMGTKTLGEATAKGDGELWVVINDADTYRWDNAGLFFLKVIKK